MKNCSCPVTPSTMTQSSFSEIDAAFGFVSCKGGAETPEARVAREERCRKCAASEQAAEKRRAAKVAKDVEELAGLPAAFDAFNRYLNGQETPEDRIAEADRCRKRAAAEKAAQKRKAARAAKVSAERGTATLLGGEFFTFDTEVTGVSSPGWPGEG